MYELQTADTAGDDSKALEDGPRNSKGWSTLLALAHAIDPRHASMKLMLGAKISGQSFARDIPFNVLRHNCNKELAADTMLVQCRLVVAKRMTKMAIALGLGC
eukprot:1179300-Prorocentrum_minimum.AAC.3